MQREEGMRVLIVQDCRDGSPATGQTGIYEGDFPRGALVKIDGELCEYDYAKWVEWLETAPKPKPPLWDQGEPEPEGDSWFPTDNPRIRLEDGSVIWGDECWWRPAEDAPPLAEAQEDLEKHKTVLRYAFRALSELARDEATES